MPIAIACPSCKARLQAPDSAVGKRVKCPKCQTPIPVPDAGDSPAPPKQSAPAPSKAPAKKSAPDNDFNFDEDERPAKKSAPPKRRDDDDDDDRPAPKKNAGIKKGRDDDYDDDDDRPSKKGGAVKKSRDDDYDDDDRPSKKGASSRRDRDDDYDDDDDDRPKKKGKKGRPVGNFPTPTQEDMSNAFNMYLFAFIANLVVGGSGSIVFLIMWFMKRKESPLVDWHGKQVINAWISAFICAIAMGVLGCGAGFGLAQIDPSLSLIAFVFYLVMLGYAVFVGILFLIGMFKAKSGQYWRFPGVWHLLK